MGMARRPTLPPSLRALRDQCYRRLDVAAYYQAVVASGWQLNGEYRALVSCWLGDGEALVEVAAPDESNGPGPYPGLVDSCFNALGVATHEGWAASTVYVPSG